MTSHKGRRKKFFYTGLMLSFCKIAFIFNKAIYKLCTNLISKKWLPLFPTVPLPIGNQFWMFWVLVLLTHNSSSVNSKLMTHFVLKSPIYPLFSYTNYEHFAKVASSRTFLSAFSIEFLIISGFISLANQLVGQGSSVTFSCNIQFLCSLVNAWKLCAFALLFAKETI